MKVVTLQEACMLLAIDVSTLYRWIGRAGITIQEDEQDKRRKMITLAQVRHLAKLHHRALPSQSETTPEESDTDARIATLEARVAELEHLVDELRTRPAPAPVPPTMPSPLEQKVTQANPPARAAGDTLPPGYTPLADVIREYHLQSRRKSIHRHMSHYFKPGGPWVVGGRKIEAALDEEGVQQVLKFVGIT
jgi:hypothetical protein